MSEMNSVKIQKPLALEQISYDESGVIEASAGTGKTYTIEHMVVDLVVERNVPISQILVVTFTDRATAELVGRVREILKTMLEATEDEVDDASSPVWVIGKEERERLRKALLTFDRAPVYTIHGFCNRILSEHAFPNQRPFEQELVPGDEVFQRVFPRVLRDTYSVEKGYREILQAFLEENDPGKLQKLLQQSTGTWEEIRPRLSDSELRQMEQDLHSYVEEFDLIKKNIQAALDEGEVNGNSTSKVERTLEYFERAVQDQRDRKEIDIWTFLGTLRRLSGDDDPIFYFVHKKGDKDWMPPEVPEHLGDIYDRELSVEIPIVNQFADVMEARLDQEKNSKGEYTYDDMLGVVNEGLNGPKGEELTRTLRSEFDYAIIDEFQDTNPVQWEIFKSIFYNSGSENPCYLIGDPKQAIYGFRGADVQTYRTVREQVKNERGQENIVNLGTNYRSTPELVEAYNKILGDDESGSFFSEDGHNKYETPVEAGFKDKWFGVSQEEKAPAIKVSQLKGEGINASDYRQILGRHYASEIRTLLDSEPSLKISNDDGGEAEPIEAKDIYILVNSHREGDLVSKYLDEQNVPYSFFKQEGLFQSNEARDLLHVLKATMTPGDRSRRLMAWKTDFFNIGLENLEQANRHVGQGHPLMRRLVDWHELAESGEFGKLINSILHDSGVFCRAIYQHPTDRTLTNYHQLGERMIDWWRNNSLTAEKITAKLGRYVREEQKTGEEDDDTMHQASAESTVQIMTMHKAKGLEAPVVFVYGGWSRGNSSVHTFYPEDSSERVKYFGNKKGCPYEEEINQYNREEDERVMYVAMTRAEGRLYLPHAPENERANKPGVITPLMDRLDDVLGKSEGSPDHFELEHVDEEATLPETAEPVEPDEYPTLTESDDIKTPPDLEFANYRANSRLFVESYSSVQHQQHSTEDIDAQFEWLEKQPSNETSTDDPELPAGSNFGLFFHEILENIDFDLIEQYDHGENGLKQFTQDPDVIAMVASKARKYSIDTNFNNRVIELAWNTLVRSIQVSGITIDGLYTAPEINREMEFWLPIPEDDHQSLFGAGKDSFQMGENPPFEVDRGYLRGFIDLVFEWNGQVFVADWKTDSLPGTQDFSRQNLASVVDEKYTVQNQFYAFALARMLRRSPRDLMEDFGGVFYFFVRGMDEAKRNSKPPSGNGVYFSKPDKSELQTLSDQVESILNNSIQTKKAAIKHG